MKETSSAVERHPGRVLSAAGGVYDVELADGTVVPASLRGRLKLEARTGDKVVAGDRVEVELAADRSGATIESVAPRESELARRAPGRSRGAKVLVANPDRLVAVFSVTHPEPNPRLLDRFLVMAEVNHIPAVVVANKVDLGGRGADIFAAQQSAGYRVLRTSAQTGLGLEELRAMLCEGTSVLAGPSGVGKSSLLNAIEPGLSLRIGAVSDAVGKGRHTTVTARLIPLPCGGYVADTPGLRELGLYEVTPGELADAFPEFRDHAGECRFAPDCSHSHEPGCAVTRAVRSGAISPERHASYLALLEEIRESERKRW